MGYTVLAEGLVLIVVAWLSFKYPNIINPYGSLPPERKALVDIEGLKKVVAILLSVTGFLLVITATLFMVKVIAEDTCGIVMTILVLAMLVPLSVAMKRYNAFGRDPSGSNLRFVRDEMLLGSDKSGKLVKSARASKITWSFTWIIMVFVAVIMVLSLRSPQITVGEGTVKISGLYGREIPIAEVVSVELLDELPSVYRVNGSETGRRLKGHFRLKNGKKCLVFVRKQAPYIEIRTTDQLFYLNGETKEETMEILSKVTECYGKGERQ